MQLWQSGQIAEACPDSQWLQQTGAASMLTASACNTVACVVSHWMTLPDLPYKCCSIMLHSAQLAVLNQAIGALNP